MQRLAIGLTSQLIDIPKGKPVFWLHALSVGEVTSALPLVQELREAYPEATIVISTTTRTGMQVARTLLSSLSDALIYGPFDLFPVINTFITRIQPNLFILVETDFWPNWLYQLHKRKVPTLLVNGRISQKSYAAYRCFAFFFRPMFSRFSFLAMQTARDKEYMEQLGLAPNRVAVLGNLKFSGAAGNKNNAAGIVSKKEDIGLAQDAPLWICGSTHKGEEILLLDAYDLLRREVPTLSLMIAPRNIDRADTILHLATARGYSCTKKSVPNKTTSDVLILDTIGELAGCYQLADIAFIGGSLVAEGGHNPIEPAAFGVPVFFGPHMDDFQEIANELQASGGGTEVTTSAMLAAETLHMMTDTVFYHRASEAAKQCVNRHGDVMRQHLVLVNQLLQSDSN